MATLIASASAVSSHATANPEEHNVYNDSLSFSNNQLIEKRRVSGGTASNPLMQQAGPSHLGNKAKRSCDANPRDFTMGVFWTFGHRNNTDNIFFLFSHHPGANMFTPTSTNSGVDSYGVTSSMDSPLFTKENSLREERLKRRLRFFFLNPVQKWAATRRFPFKLSTQILKIVFVTVQVSLPSSSPPLQVLILMISCTFRPVVVSLCILQGFACILRPEHGGRLLAHLPPGVGCDERGPALSSIGRTISGVFETTISSVFGLCYRECKGLDTWTRAQEVMISLTC